MQRFSFYILIGLTVSTLSSCAVGMLLFYKESNEKVVYRSSKSKKNYFTITALTLNHCGCTHLFIDNYKNGKKDFLISYYPNTIRKQTYRHKDEKPIIIRDSGRLETTQGKYFDIAFDSLDKKIFSIIDSLASYPPKGTYQIKKPNYTCYVMAVY